MALLIPIQTLIPITLVIIILIVVTWVIFNKNKKIAVKLVSEKIRFQRYKKGIEGLKKAPTNPKKDFETLNQYVRAFFKEYLNLDYSLTYLELENTFKKQKKGDYAKFCKLMSDVNYKGKQKEVKDLEQAVLEFRCRYRGRRKTVGNPNNQDGPYPAPPRRTSRRLHLRRLEKPTNEKQAQDDVHRVNRNTGSERLT